MKSELLKDSTPSINQDEYLKNISYPRSEILLDIVLFALAGWSQFGYASFSGQVSFESVTDPMERYLFPYLSAEWTAEILDGIKYTVKAFAYADALLTTGSYIYMRNCRQEFLTGIKKGWRGYQSRQFSLLLLGLNFLLIFYSFVAGSFTPWAGLILDDHGDLMCNISGPTMFIGLIISYAMSNAPYVFSMTQEFLNFSQLTSDERKEIYQNIFLTKKGLLGFLPRTLINMVNRSWTFYGIAVLTMKYVFHCNSPAIIYFYSMLSAISSGYQTVTSQGIKDYKVTFSAKNKSLTEVLIVTEKNNKNGKINKIVNESWLFRIGNGILVLLVAAVFLLRMLTVPSLYTGEIEDPANNYSTKDSCIAALGLLFGGYASYQYARFRYSRWQDNINAFFQPQKIKAKEVENKEDKDINEHYEDQVSTIVLKT